MIASRTTPIISKEVRPIAIGTGHKVIMQPSDTPRKTTDKRNASIQAGLKMFSHESKKDQPINNPEQMIDLCIQIENTRKSRERVCIYIRNRIGTGIITANAEHNIEVMGNHLSRLLKQLTEVCLGMPPTDYPTVELNNERDRILDLCSELAEKNHYLKESGRVEEKATIFMLLKQLMETCLKKPENLPTNNKKHFKALK